MVALAGLQGNSEPVRMGYSEFLPRLIFEGSREVVTGTRGCQILSVEEVLLVQSCVSCSVFFLPRYLSL